MANNGSQKRYPPELKERAVKMALELRAEDPGDNTVVSRVARQLGVGKEALRNWLKQSEIDVGRKPGTTTVDAQRIAELEREVRDLRRANDILKAASVFFATELDGRLKR
ncbi:MAG TPA: transposase [Acidimicrobiales bacterium]|nr:transposase [Acidimicrobiales bacterium]